MRSVSNNLRRNASSVSPQSASKIPSIARRPDYDCAPLHLAALLYLTAIGSVVGFTTYLMLVERIGSSRAAYTTVLFPIVALSLSTIFEGYRWDGASVIGLVLTILGNVVIFTGGKARRIE